MRETIAFLWFLSGCGAAPQCIEGASVACACTDGRTGAQICRADHTLGMCVCSGGTDAGMPIDAPTGVDAGNDHLRTYQFSGHVIVLDDEINATPFKLSQPMTGRYTFDITTTDSNPDPTVGMYASADASIEVSIGGVTMSSAPDAFEIRIGNRGPSEGGDHYGAIAGAVVLSPGTFTLDNLGLQLFDTDGTAVESDALPAAAPDLSRYPQGANVTINGCDTPDCANPIQVIATVESLGP